MEDIDFLKSNAKNSSKSSGSEVDLTKPEKEGKPKKKPDKAKKKKPKKKENKKGFFAGLFGSKKSVSAKPKEPEKPAETKVLPPLKPVEKKALDKIISEETKPLAPSPLIPEKPEPKPKPKPKPVVPPPPPPAPAPELEQTVEKIKNGEIPLEAIDVNLIPREMLQDLKPERKIINLIWIGLAALVIVIAIYGVMFYLQSYFLKQTQVNQEKIETLEDEIIAYKPLQEKVAEYDRSIANVNDLLEKHIYWNVFFQLLEANMLSNVELTNMTGQVDGLFSLTAIAPDYKTVTGQVEAFRRADNFIRSVEINSATANMEEGKISTVTFSMTLKVEPGIFIRKGEEK